MHKTSTGLALGFAACASFACAPDLRAGEGEHCDQSSSCSEGLACYRGFCLPDGTAPRDPAVVEREGGTEILAEGPPGPAAIADGVGAPTDAIVPQSATDIDAASPIVRLDEAGAAPSHTPADAGGADAGSGRAAGPTPPPSVSSVPATLAQRDGGPSPGSGDPGRQPPPATKPSASDAGGDAGDARARSDAAVIGRCTLEECCAEAARARGGDRRGKGEKRCGCDDARFLRALACALVPSVTTLSPVPLP